MLNSQTMSLNQKWKFWRQHKEDKFKEIANSQSAIYNYFYNNNDIFKFIDEDDHLYYSYLMTEYLNTQANIFIGSVVTVFLFDRFILNKFLPHLRFKEMRLTANIIKFLFWPYALFKVVDFQFLDSYRNALREEQERYNFGFKDYIKGNKIFERALTVNRLQELLEKRGQFDWTNVPQIVQEQ